MTQYLVGVDVGSSDCKVVVIDAAGSVVASSAHPYPTHYPRPGWADQDPEDWYRAACQTIKTAVDAGRIDIKKIVGLAIDGPAHNVALMDDTGAVIYPTLHWSDLRSTSQSEFLEADYGDRIYEITYSRPNPSWTLSQLLWLKENEPAIWSQLRRILVTKDFVRYRFTGAYQTDVYDAIGTQLYDVNADVWSDELCAVIGFDRDRLPAITSPVAIGGRLLPEAARAAGLLPGIPVIVGSGDSVVEAAGIGAIDPGQCIIKLGTAANVNLVTAHQLPTPTTITYRHVVNPHWFTITPTNSGASTMRWFCDTFCRLEVEQARAQGVNVYALIDQLAAGASPGSQGLLFHPYLMGERAPYWDPHLRADFMGISAQHGANHFARAILEGVAYSIRDCFQIVRELGPPIATIYLIGGGAKSPLWRQVICDVLGMPLIKPMVEDAAFGAAMIAGIGVGVFPDWESAVQTCARVEEVLQPNPETLDLYDDYFETYRAVTQDLAIHSHKLAHLAKRNST